MIPNMPESVSDVAFEKTPVEYAQYCRRKAFQHAASLLDLFQIVQKIGIEISVTDSVIATSVYQCTIIIIRLNELGEFANEQVMSQTMSRLSSVTDILDGLSSVNKVVDEIVSNER
jgi:hypothetical protein